jgi:RNA polymerase sigma-70 factor (ECF subfamily)
MVMDRVAQELPEKTETPSCVPLDIRSYSVAAISVEDEQRLQEWIGHIVDRDQSAFSSLYNTMIGRVYGLALRITHHVQLAEEVAEDTFWQVWRQAPRFDPARGKAIVWIMTIARSRALDVVRRKSRTDSNDEPVKSLEGESSGNNPSDLLAVLQEEDRLHAALSVLEPIPRQLLALAFFRGLTHEEIAVHTRLPLGTVKSYIRCALICLRQKLAADADSI